jgi:hypothetical protein
MTSPRNPQAPHPSRARSRITNGKTLLQGIDGRSTWVRRLRDLINQHLSDLGGPDMVSEAERSIIRRASAVTVELERLELRFAEANLAGRPPDPIDFDLYLRGANSLRRLLESVGLQRRPRDVTPSVREYLAAETPSEAPTDDFREAVVAEVAESP